MKAVILFVVILMAGCGLAGSAGSAGSDSGAHVVRDGDPKDLVRYRLDDGVTCYTVYAYKYLSCVVRP